MGLYLNYQLQLPSPVPTHETTALLTRLRTFALTQPFAKVSELYDARANGMRRLATVVADAFKDENPHLIAAVDTARGFSVLPGDGCESAVMAFIQRRAEDGRPQDWFWHWSCKTQYASVLGDRHLVACHTGLVQLLEYAITIGITVVVRDETHYWETRDETRLIAEVNAMNRVVARVAGQLNDFGTGLGAAFRAPIFRHPRFEHLEMEGDESS